MEENEKKNQPNTLEKSSSFSVFVFPVYLCQKKKIKTS